MDIEPKELAIAVGVGTGIVGFFAQWTWNRLWGKKDAKAKAAAEAEKEQLRTMTAAIQQQADRIVVVERQLTANAAREDERSKALGKLEAEHQRLDGRLEGLQTFWRTEFTKMREEFGKLEEKVDYRLDNFRMELRGDQQKFEERLTQLFTAHQGRIHDRINVMAAEQAKALNTLIDELTERAGEPRPSPATPGT